MVDHLGMGNGGWKVQPSPAQWRRRLALRRRRAIAFVLSGGGPLGALQVGTLRALFEQGIKPDLVVGTSVGALNGAFLAFDPSPKGVEKLADLWRGLGDSDLFPLGRFKPTWARMVARGDRVFDNSGIRKLIESRVGDADFGDARIPLAVVATDLETGAEEVFTAGDVARPLLASTAMPGIFPPIEINGSRYVDGGVSDAVPIGPAVSLGARTVYVIDASSHGRQSRPLIRPMDYLLHGFSLARSQRFRIERPLFEERIKLVVLPTPPLEFFVPMTSMRYTQQLIDMSYAHTRRFLTGMPAEEAEASGTP
jgi:NTE family protein